MTIKLYRAVSEAEYQQIMKMGRFEQGSNSLEGKWFAEEYDHALQWGRLFYPDGNFKVVEIALTTEVADTLFRHPRLDGIGPARYATLDQLEGVVIRAMEQ